MVLVGAANGHDDVSYTDIELRKDRFLYPELFQRDLAAAFYFAFIFAGFLFFYLYCSFGTSMLKFYLAAIVQPLPKSYPR